MFKPGDRVSIKGWDDRLDGMAVVVAPDAGCEKGLVPVQFNKYEYLNGTGQYHTVPSQYVTLDRPLTPFEKDLHAYIASELKA